MGNTALSVLGFLHDKGGLAVFGEHRMVSTAAADYDVGSALPVKLCSDESIN
jgi:hypothetical protein